MNDTTRFMIKKSINSDVIYKLVNDEPFVWFVNNSESVLSKVVGAEGGFQTCGDDVVNLNSVDSSYENVLPGEAVAIAPSPDPNYDSDFLIEYYVKVTINGVDSEYRSGLEKGGNPNATLLWRPLPSAPTIDVAAAAAKYIDNYGKTIARNAYINYGDIVFGCLKNRLAESGLRIDVVEKIRDSVIKYYKITHTDGITYYESYDAGLVLKFLELLKK